ncbi:MAG: septation protein A [Alphaproteobacteria bacterium]|nr:septation protein A [Alphaproteobacteria bacterium]
MSEPRNSGGGRKLAALACELGPLVLFFLVNGRYGPLGALADALAGPLGAAQLDATRRGLFAGTAIFMVATAIALPAYRRIEGRWPVMPLVGGFFILVFGGLTLWLQDELFIKVKPTIVNCLFGTILTGGLLFGRPLMKLLFGTAFRLTDQGWTILTARWAFFFFVLAGINEVMWRFFSTETWILSKMALSLPLTLIFAVAQTPLLKRHWDGEDNPFKVGGTSRN